MDAPSTVGRCLVTLVQLVGITHAHHAGGLEALAHGVAGGQVLVLGARDDPGRLVLGHEPGRELGRLDVEIFQVRGIRQLVLRGGHQCGPLAVEVDQVLGDHLTFLGVGVQQRLVGAPGQHSAQLPAEVPAVLHGYVHALAGLGGVRVARIAGDEHAGHSGAAIFGVDVVEMVRQPVADLVDRGPCHGLHVHAVGVDDLVGALDDLLNRGLAHLAVVIRGHFAQVHVHAEQMTALAGNQKD